MTIAIVPSMPCESPTTRLWLVDAFCDGPFTGNPAAVCLLPGRHWPGDAWMQQLAGEMNQSETAFILCNADDSLKSNNSFGLRWFTPAAEVELCGHATLASAHMLWSAGCADEGRPIRFHTRFSGELACRCVLGRRIAMDFPAQRCEPRDPPPGLLPALGLDPGDAVSVSFGRYDWIVEAREASLVRGLTVDFAALLAFEGRGLAVTARSADTPGIDFVSRFFAPKLRVHEDPVTGSLHCVLGPYWADRLGRHELGAWQCSPRGGRIDLHVQPARVVLIGQARTVLQGTLA